MSANLDYQIFFAQEPDEIIANILKDYPQDKVFILTDRNVKNKVLTKLPLLKDYPVFVAEPGEKSKSIETAAQIWKFLTDKRADRHSLLINIGGGVITDLGGFVASTYKRGIDYINIPTTLLAQVDASVGGKTAVNFSGIKNLVGTFSNPKAVIINVNFVKTLEPRHFISGFAEIVKHALLSGQADWIKTKAFNPNEIDFDYLEVLVKSSVAFKSQVVAKDPKDKNWRKILNYGHTIGHAVEAYFNNKGADILHGEAVAVGLLAETYLSNRKLLFNLEKVLEVSAFISKTFPVFRIPYEDYGQIIDFIAQDKKNRENKFMFVLLKDFGEPVTDQEIDRSEIIEALNFYRQFTNT